MCDNATIDTVRNLISIAMRAATVVVQIVVIVVIFHVRRQLNINNVLKAAGIIYV